MRAWLITTILLAVVATGGNNAARFPGNGALVARAVSDPHRPKAKVAMDAYRKPAETIRFAGVKAGMRVGEFYPGGGYFTQMLSRVVGPTGHIYGLENSGWAGAVRLDRELVASRKLENVSIQGAPIGEVSFPEPLDLVWITLNYHDLKIPEFGKVDTRSFDRAVFKVLKPGGTFLIIDHEAPAGASPEAIATLHRIEMAMVVREVTGAGFRLVAEGTFLRQLGDDHSLPSSDPRIKGRTDQYALKFMKPPA